MKKYSHQERLESEHFDHMSKTYDENYGYLDSFTKYKIKRKISDFVSFVSKNKANKKLKILDVGCGTGEYTKYICEKFPDSNVVGLDISPEIIEIARNKLRKKKNVKFVVGSAYKTPFKQGEFDVVCGFYVLHHMDLNRYSKEMYRILKGDGVAFYYEPNILNPVVFLIKSIPFLKKIVGDSPGEWAINPLNVEHYFQKGLVKLKLTDFVVPIKFLDTETLIGLDKKANMVSQLPLFKYFGGSVQIMIDRSNNGVTDSGQHSDGNKHMSEYLLDRFNEVEKFHWWWEGRREFIKSWLTKKSSLCLLDVGCGTGETLSFIKKLLPKSKLFGIDTSFGSIKYSKSRGHKNVQLSDALKLPFEDSRFDCVLFLDVLEHIKRDDLAIKEAKRVLKKGGKIIITAPALKFIWSEHDTKQGHKRRYSIVEVRKLAESVGLVVEKVSYFNSILSIPIIVIRLLSRVKIFDFLSSYDNSVNYDIAFKENFNSVLKFIFVNEVKLLKFFNYPIGISVGAVFRKS